MHENKKALFENLDWKAQYLEDMVTASKALEFTGDRLLIKHNL